MEFAEFAPFVAAAGTLVAAVIRALEKNVVAAVGWASAFVLSVAAAVANI